MSFHKIIFAQFLGRKKKNPTNCNIDYVSSILIRPIGEAIGDAVAHTVYARQLKLLQPNCKIGVIATERNRDVFLISPHIDYLIEDSIIESRKQRNKWHIMLDCYESFTTQHLIQDWLIHPDIKIIFNKKAKSHYNTKTIQNYDFHCPPPVCSHIYDYLKYSILNLNNQLNSDAGTAELQIPNNTVLPFHSKWLSSNHIRILIAPCGSHSERTLPAHELAALLNRVAPSINQSAYYLIPHLPHNPNYFKELIVLCNHKINFHQAPPTTLLEYITLIKNADIVISVDSGSVHLACALKKPLLALYANHQENLTMWCPRPHDNVPTKTLIAQTEPSRKTCNFNLTAAANWLNHQIQKQLHNIN